MPYPPPLPPPDEGGAVLQPRQLNRWLDINPIHKLTRTQGYFNLPVFSVASQWKGYSEIVGVFNYTSTKNFSLKTLTPPSNPNYVACIMWVDDEYNVYRYRLWEGVGEVFYFDIPLYSGQLIKKNFRIEIWNVAIEDSLSFSLSEAGTADANQLYTLSPIFDGVYDNTVNAITIEFDGVDTWNVIDLGLELYSIPNTQFPFGFWEVESFGVSPAPFTYISTTCDCETALTFYTSILGGFDYRFATDSTVATPSTVVTDFGWSLSGGSFPLPFVWPTDSVPELNT